MSTATTDTTACGCAAPVQPVPDEVEPVAAAAAIRGQLVAGRAEGELRRRLPAETVAALTEAGQFRTLVPRRFGGLESPLRTVVDATAEISAGDPSAGWVTMILSCGDWLVGLFPDTAQEEVYAEGPDARVCSVFNPSSAASRVPGGWMVDGRWFPSSGCRHASWAMVGVPLVGFDGEPQGPAFALVSMDELVVSDTWNTVGMRATGSDTIAGTGLFVPEHRVLPVGPAVEGVYPTSRSDLPRYRSAMMPTLVTYLMAPFIGMAAAALEIVVEAAPRRAVTFTDYARQIDSTAFQLAVADAATRIDVARTLAHRAADEVDGHAAAGTYPNPAARARIRGWTGHAVAECRTAVDVLASAYGAAAFAEGNPLQGIVRDIQTASRHAIASPVSNAEIYGKALLGVTPNITPLI